MKWYLAALKRYAEFGGRSRRMEYWMFTLFNILVPIALVFVEAMLGTGGVIAGLYFLGVLIPSIAVTIRRLHDTDRSGWWLLLAIVPIANIVLLVFMCLDGTAGSNRFGANPKEAAPA